MNKFWYKPFTFFPAEIETWVDKKGKTRTRIKRKAYYQQTYAPGTVLKSGGKEYVVQEGGALKRKDINRAERRKDKNRPKKEVK